MDWNQLEDNVVHANSVESFKALVAKTRPLCAAHALLRCINARQLDAAVYFIKMKKIKIKITISEDMKWAPHINKITKKANSTLGFIHRNLKRCPINCRRMAYIALARPLLE